jgi:serine/threonine-protein kinase RsbW
MDDGLIWLQLPADLSSLARFTEFAREGARSAGLPESALGKLDLILEEVLVNIFRYAGSPDAAVGYAVPAPSCLRVDISDAGSEFNPLHHASPDLDGSLEDRPIGGLGIFLVQSMAESVEYRRQNGRNILTFNIR